MNMNKRLNIEFKSFSSLDKSTPLQWEGYVAAYNNVDSWGDVIIPGAFNEEFGNVIPAFYEHDDYVGKMLIEGDDEFGLKIKAEMMPDDLLPQELKGLSDRVRWSMSPEGVGALSWKMSIGYRAIKSSTGIKDGKNVTFLEKIKLFEGSLVLMPANERAIITDYKSVGDQIENAFKKRDSDKFNKQLSELSSFIKSMI